MLALRLWDGTSSGANAVNGPVWEQDPGASKPGLQVGTASRFKTGRRWVAEAFPGLNPWRAVRVPTGWRVFFLTGFPVSKSLLPCQPLSYKAGPSGGLVRE